MIVEFSMQNFRSIKDLQTISFVATGLKSPNGSEEIDEGNIAEKSSMKLLKTVGIYGANGSGKSNIIRGLEYFLNTISREASSESKLFSLCDPFLYQKDSSFSESYFQIVLIVNDKKFRYGFTVKVNPVKPKDPDDKYSKEIITSEWLYGTKGKNLVKYFIRKNNEIEDDTLPNKEKIPKLSYQHTLFLTHCAAFDSEGDIASIKNYLKGWTLSNFTSGTSPFRWNTIYLIEREKRKKDFIELLAAFNLNYNDIIIEKDPEKPDPKTVPQDKIIMVKNYYLNDEELKVRLNLSKNESSGTKKLFDLAGLLLRAFNLDKSAFIILDEIDSNFHPSLLIKLIELFNNKRLNKSNCQLLFSSHDTNLMDPKVMRRDQFYFTEKTEENSTRVYSLADLKGIRNDADFAKQYLAGYYGAIPQLHNYEKNNGND